MDVNTELHTENITPKASESTLQLARANGEFYNAVLTTFLSKGNGKGKNQQLKQSLDRLPPHAKSLYERGIQDFEGELAENHALLELHRGRESGYLLECVMLSKGRTPEQIVEVLSHVTPDKARFVEPIPGVALIQVEKDLYRYLQETDVIPTESHAVQFGSDTKAEPSFMILQRLSLQKGLNDAAISPAEDPTIRHEFHHFVWNFLERAKFVREPQDTTPELSKAFGNFRNELSAYIIQNRSLTEIDPLAMVYTKDQDIQKKANDVKSLTYVCMELAKSKMMDPSTFLYPAMTSRNFRELEEKFLELTPVEGQVDNAMLDTIYSLWRNKGALLQSVMEVLQRKNVKVSPDAMRAFAEHSLESPGRKSYGNFYGLRDFQSVAEKLEQFGEAFGVTEISAKELLEGVLRGKLPIPDEMIKQVLNIPNQLIGNLPVVNDPEAFLTSYLSLWRIDDEGQRAVYSQLISATPEMRVTFDRVKDDILEKDEREFRMEFGYEGADEERKKQIDQDLQKKVQLFKAL